VTILAAVKREAPGSVPGAPVPPTHPDAELNRRDFLTLVGGAVIASAGAQPARTSGAADTIAALASPATQPLTALAPAAAQRGLPPPPAWTGLGAHSRAARLLRVTNSSRNVLKAVTKFLSRDASLNLAWARLATSLGVTPVENPAPARAHGVGSPHHLAGTPNPARLRGVPSLRHPGRAALRRGVALGVRHAARRRRGPMWAAVRHVTDPRARQVTTSGGS
jgi:hypothetical protein